MKEQGMLPHLILLFKVCGHSDTKGSKEWIAKISPRWIPDLTSVNVSTVSQEKGSNDGIGLLQ